MLTHPIAKHFCGIAPSGDKFGMRAAIADAGQGHWRSRNFLHRLGRCHDHLCFEARLEFAQHGNVEQGVQRVLGFALGNLGYGIAFVAVLQFQTIGHIEGNPADFDVIGLVARTEQAAALILNAFQHHPARRILELHQFLGNRSGADFLPFRNGISQIVVLERELRGKVGGQRLGQHAQPLILIQVAQTCNRIARGQRSSPMLV